MLGKGGRKAAFNIYVMLTYTKIYPCYMCLGECVPCVYPYEHCLCPSACASLCAHVHVDLCMDVPAYSTSARKIHVHADMCVQLPESHANQCDPCPHPFSMKLGAPIMAVLAPLPVLILAATWSCSVSFFSLAQVAQLLLRWGQ